MAPSVVHAPEHQLLPAVGQRQQHDEALGFVGIHQAAVEDMIAAARELGADGVVGVDFDYEVLGEKNGMMMVAVGGTAVKMA